MEEEIQIIGQKEIRRKIQIVGGNTITVSLPRSWAVKNRLGKESGEEQEISMRNLPDGTLLLSPANISQVHLERIRHHKISVNPNLSTLKRIILADYVGGIDVIKLHLTEPLKFDFYQELQNYMRKKMVGFDMIEMDNTIEVISMTQAPKFDVYRLLEIIRVQSERMVLNSISWLTKKIANYDKVVEQIKEMETTLDRHANQMMRTLQLSILDFFMAEKVNLPMAEILYWSSVTRSVESASDLTVSIAELGTMIDKSKLPKKFVEDLVNLAIKIKDLYSDSMKSFINDDYELAHDILNQLINKSITDHKKWPIQIDHSTEPVLYLVIRNLEKIAVYTKKIAEASIDCESAKIAQYSIQREN